MAGWGAGRGASDKYVSACTACEGEVGASGMGRCMRGHAVVSDRFWHVFLERPRACSALSSNSAS